MFEFPPENETFARLARRARNCAGFTLVEVVIALGIITTSLVAMLGIMPVGLETLRAAGAENTRAQIVQQLTSQAMLTPFSTLDTFVAASPYHFDDTGWKQERLDGDTRFEVTVSRTSTAYPGSPQATGLAGSVTTLIMEVQSLPGNATPAKYVIHLANQGS